MPMYSTDDEKLFFKMLPRYECLDYRSKERREVREEYNRIFDIRGLRGRALFEALVMFGHAKPGDGYISQMQEAAAEYEEAMSAQEIMDGVQS